jgi:hypothetical protein
VVLSLGVLPIAVVKGRRPTWKRGGSKPLLKGRHAEIERVLNWGSILLTKSKLLFHIYA